MLLYCKDSLVYVDISNQKNRVQEIRLYASMLEAGWNLYVSKDQLSSLRQIKGIKTGTTSNKKKVDITILTNHSMPITSINNVASELIFPEWFFNKNNDLSKSDKAIFEGLVTKERIKYLARMLDHGRLREKLCLYTFYIGKKYSGFIVGKLLSTRNVRIKFSFKGRKKDFKLYDNDYFYNLGSNKFVICPPGDFVWTYRLFETVIVKSIPIINHEDAYVNKYGLITKTINDIKHLNHEDFNDIVNKNYEIVKKNICKRSSLKDLLNHYEQKV